jgi:hypothetical protein
MNKIIICGIVFLISINLIFALEIKLTNQDGQQDLDVFSPGSEIVISALSNEEKAEVTLLFNGKDEIFNDIMEKSDQGFEYKFEIPKTMKKGDYTVVVNDGKETATKDFKIEEIVNMKFVDSNDEKVQALKQKQEQLKLELEQKGYSQSFIQKILAILEAIWRNYILI